MLKCEGWKPPGYDDEVCIIHDEPMKECIAALTARAEALEELLLDEYANDEAECDHYSGRCRCVERAMPQARERLKEALAARGVR